MKNREHWFSLMFSNRNISNSKKRGLVMWWDLLKSEWFGHIRSIWIWIWCNRRESAQPISITTVDISVSIFIILIRPPQKKRQRRDIAQKTAQLIAKKRRSGQHWMFRNWLIKWSYISKVNVTSSVCRKMLKLRLILVISDYWMYIFSNRLMDIL